MKEYISPRCLALVVAVALIVALLLMAKWGTLSSEAISGLLGVIAASLRDLLKRDTDSTAPTSPITIAGVGILAAGLAGIVGGGCASAPSHNTTSAVVKTVEVSTDACKAIADLHGRSDIATGCEITGGVVSILDKLLSEAEQAKKDQPQAVSHDVCTPVSLDAGLLDSRK